MADQLAVREQREPRCDKWDLPVSSCGHCNGAVRREQAQERGEQAGRSEGWGVWFTAGRHGRCAGPCDEPVKPGDRIRADGEGGYLCEVCGGDEPS